jgi:hypothetical protein
VQAKLEQKRGLPPSQQGVSAKHGGRGSLRAAPIRCDFARKGGLELEWVLRDAKAAISD